MVRLCVHHLCAAAAAAGGGNLAHNFERVWLGEALAQHPGASPCLPDVPGGTGWGGVGRGGAGWGGTVTGSTLSHLDEWEADCFTPNFSLIIVIAAAHLVVGGFVEGVRGCLRAAWGCLGYAAVFCSVLSCSSWRCRMTMTGLS